MNSSVIQETAAVQKPAHELRKYVSWLFAVIITVLVAGAVLEVAGRYYIRLRTAQLPVIFGNANWGGLHEYDPDLLWKMLPNKKGLPVSLSRFHQQPRAEKQRIAPRGGAIPYSRPWRFPHFRGCGRQRTHLAGLA